MAVGLQLYRTTLKGDMQDVRFVQTDTVLSYTYPLLFSTPVGYT